MSSIKTYEVVWRSHSKYHVFYSKNYNLSIKKFDRIVRKKETDYFEFNTLVKEKK
jgi:hypothetical protein